MLAHQLIKKLNIRYFILITLAAGFLVLSAVFTGYAAPLTTPPAFVGSKTPTGPWTVVQPASSATPEPISSTTAPSLVNNDGPFFIYLPIIVKPQYTITAEGIALISAITVAQQAPDQNIFVDPTAPNPTITGSPAPGTPGTPGTGTPKTTVTPTATPTLGPILIPDGDIEGGGDQSQSRWTRFSLKGHRVIFDNDVDSGPPRLPVSPSSGGAMVWLGGDDNELSFVQTTFFLPAERPFLFHYADIRSEDPICAKDLFSNGTVAEQLRLATGNTVNNLQSDVAGLIITADGLPSGVATLDLCAARAGQFTVVYNTNGYAGGR